jgi:hypothetical protein
MPNVIIWTHPVSGNVCQTVPMEEDRFPGESEEDWYFRAAVHAVPDGVTWRIVDEAELPQDRANRDTWEDDGETVKVSPGRKAKLAKEKADKEHEKRSAAGKVDDVFEGVSAAPLDILSGVRVGLTGSYIVSGGTDLFSAGLVTALRPGQSAVLLSEGSEEVTLEVTPSGTARVRRTHGHQTYRIKVALISL